MLEVCPCLMSPKWAFLCQRMGESTSAAPVVLSELDAPPAPESSLKRSLNRCTAELARLFSALWWIHVGLVAKYWQFRCRASSAAPKGARLCLDLEHNLLRFT
jgi:hypothetical protein